MKIFQRICKLREKENLRKRIAKRLSEFERMGERGSREWFLELCFCILTANCSAELGMKIQERIGKGFLWLSEEALAERLKRLGYRFPKTRAKFILESREWAEGLKDILTEKRPEKAREWLVRHIKGLGWKEASHFLRNVGFRQFAILDRHVLRLMAEEGMIPRVPKQLNKRLYLEYEEKLRKLAGRLGMSLAELDLWLWYLKTGKILK